MRHPNARLLVLTGAILLLIFTVPLEAGEMEVNEIVSAVQKADGGLCGAEAALPSEGEDLRLNASTCFCPTGLSYRIAHGWGCASTCSAATSACSALAFSVADDGCIDGVCDYGNLILHPASGCIYNHSMCPGQYLRDCDLEYRCYRCLKEQEPI